MQLHFDFIYTVLSLFRGSIQSILGARCDTFVVFLYWLQIAKQSYHGVTESLKHTHVVSLMWSGEINWRNRMLHLLRIMNVFFWWDQSPSWMLCFSSSISKCYEYGLCVMCLCQIALGAFLQSPKQSMMEVLMFIIITSKTASSSNKSGTSVCIKLTQFCCSWSRCVKDICCYMILWHQLKVTSHNNGLHEYFTKVLVW